MPQPPYRWRGRFARARSFPASFHGDERGTISIVSVFAVLLLTMLLGMVMNVGRQADNKIRMQNAADAAGYSGGLVVARGMNTLAFTNHLLFDVFAMTAFMREGRDQRLPAAMNHHGESYVGEILDAWNVEAGKFSGSAFEKFARLGPAILQKTPREQELVLRFGDWAQAASELILEPILEPILEERLIPEFQRDLVLATPDIAQTAAREIAKRHSGVTRGRGPMFGVLWRTNGTPVCGASDALDRTLPVIDPVMDTLWDQSQQIDKARKQRRDNAVRYLRRWNDLALVAFDREAKMCQFSALWRHFTCAQLNHLLDVEYRMTNLPHLIRTEWSGQTDGTAHLDADFTFVAVVYRDKMPEMMPGLYRDPIDGDSLAYAQVRFFVPRNRLVWHWSSPSGQDWAGNIGGHQIEWPPDDGAEPGDPPTGGEGEWTLQYGPGLSEEWSLLNQNWTVQLVPATTPSLATILQTVPPAGGTPIELPNLGGMSTEDIVTISPH
ncbi:MAG: Tad domain-containing protein [Pirellulales bacterium]|nr:Tad domain-containing protein [Pirellulales bacterium]